MSIGHFFTDRPIFASVLSILVIIVGFLAYLGLPVAQYPEVAPPTISVTATYPGASAEVIADTVAAPIEQEVNGVEGMLYMSSQSTDDGTMSLTITFAVGTDLDQAQVLVQNRVAIAEPRLPESVRRQGIITRKVSPDIMLVVHLFSPNASRDQIYITNYALLQIRDVLARIPGVGNIQAFGAREYSMRVWLDPDKIAAIGMTPQEVIAALRGQNVQVAGGALGAPPMDTGSAFQTSILLQGRLTDAEEFENIIVKQGADGRYTRLKDVARVELGASSYSTNSYIDGQPAVALVMSQRPGANALATAEQVIETMDSLAEDFPKGMAYQIAYNPTEFIQQSVDAVFQTILEAVVLVIIVILLFLQTWRAAIIPILTIPVSLIGTFAVMSALGFSLNNLTLFGLVLAIGIVVDDAIVVVENVERNLRSGCSPKDAAKRTMTEVGGALVSTTLVLFAVFVPAAALEGITGQFYRQFAVTIATATGISLFNSFTLSPALSAILLKQQEKDAQQRSMVGRWIDSSFGLFNASFDSVNRGYTGVIKFMTARTGLFAFLYVGLLVFTGFMFTQVPGGFIPAQDQGYLIVSYQLPPGASLARTDKVISDAEQIIGTIDEARFAVSFAGFSGATRTNASNAGVTFVGLEPFSNRIRTAAQIQGEVQAKLGSLQEAFVIVLSPPPIPGLGTSGGFKMMVQDRTGQGPAALEQAVQAVTMGAWQDPRLAGVFSPYNARTPQVFVDVDRTRAEILQVPVGNVFAALESYLGSVYVNDFNLFGRTYRVNAQADSQFRNDLMDVTHLRTRSQTGAIVPLGSLVEFENRIGPDRFPRYNLFPAGEINGEPARGVSSGEALSIMKALADDRLPPGFDFEWTELAYQQSQQGNTAVFVFGLSVLFVFLVLSANYESWALPLSIILIVPMCLLSAISGIWLRGMDNNILSQVGFVVLISLAAKNAILIVEFAKQKEEQEGLGYIDAAIEAAALRLRPIVMTSLAFILGVIPLMIAKGAGAEMRQALGTSVFFGMLGVTIFGLLFTPVFYVLIRSLFSDAPAHSGEEAELEEAEPESA